MLSIKLRQLSFLAVVAGLSAGGAQAAVIGPSGGTGLSSEYASFVDSPFASVDFTSGYFYLEDFEDSLLNTPGVSASAGAVTSTTLTDRTVLDSVDGDDGAIDGANTGNAGESFFASDGSAGITFSFDATVLGTLPTHAGLVWTDGFGDIIFEAFDQNGVSLGSTLGTHINSGYSGETDDDRFYGATNAGGISSIFISNSRAGVEMDHLQYGYVTPVPLPASAVLLLAGLGLMGAAARFKRI